MKLQDMDGDDRHRMIEYIVQKRQTNFEYLRKVHEGGSFWFNSVRITQADILDFYGPAKQKRVAPLLHLKNGHEYVRALAQLMEEFEYHYAPAAVQSVMRIKSRPEIQSDVVDEDLPIKPSIIKKDNIVVYEYFQTPNIPCSLDYIEVLYTLCDLMVLVYKKFMDAASLAVHEAIVRINDRIKHHVITTISMDLSRIANAIAQREAAEADPAFGAFVAAATRGTGVKDMLSILTGNS